MTEKLKLLGRVQAINWNRIQDDKDVEVWNRLVNNFWLPEKVPLSNDMQSWDTLTPDEQQLTMRVFTGLTLLDTIQGTVGAVSLIPDAITPHEEAVLHEHRLHGVRARQELLLDLLDAVPPPRRSTRRSAGPTENPNLQKKAQIVMDYYRGDDPLKRKVASTLLESFLFYSGFYLPMYWSSPGQADEHGRPHPPDHPRRGRARVLHRLQVPEGPREGCPSEREQEIKDYTFELLFELYDNEVQYTQDLYDGVGLTEDVKKFLHYNANKALMNLGYEAHVPGIRHRREPGDPVGAVAERRREPRLLLGLRFVVRDRQGSQRQRTRTGTSSRSRSRFARTGRLRGPDPQDSAGPGLFRAFSQQTEEDSDGRARPRRGT